MKAIPLINKQTIILCVAALILNVVFLYVNYHSRYYDGYKMLHGEIAYNILKHGSTKSSIKSRNYLHELWANNTFIAPEISELLKQDDWGMPSIYATNDIHIGYSLVMALVWFFTRSFSYFDILLLQVVLFLITILLWYQIAYFLFESSLVAFCSGAALILFFPITFLNVHVLRDIWPYYGIVAILYGVLSYLYEQVGVVTFICLCSFFALCQFIRPPSFIVIVMLLVLLFGMLFFRFFSRKKILIMFVCLLATNLIVFWIPYFAYNKYAYNHFFVGPVGQNLLEGLGEFSNPWGYKLEDAWFGIFMWETYGLRRGSQEADNKAKNLAYLAIRENPVFYAKCIVKRLHRLFFPALSWFQWLYNDSEYDRLESMVDRISYLIKHLRTNGLVLLDFIGRHIYIRLLLMVGYGGIILALFRRKFFAVALLGSVLVSSYSVILSHIEHRYLVPAYSVFTFFIGYVVAEGITYFLKRKTLNNEANFIDK